MQLFLTPALPPGWVWPSGTQEGLPVCPPRRWKMNGTEMKLEPGSRHQLVGGNLVIMNPTKAQDAGVYQCLASNPVGTVVSREAVLRFGCETHGVLHFGGGPVGAGKGAQKGQGLCPMEAGLGGGPQSWRTAPECPVFTPSSAGILQGGARPGENPRRLGCDAAL